MAVRTSTRLGKQRIGIHRLLPSAIISIGMVSAAILISSNKQQPVEIREHIVAEYDTVDIPVPTEPVPTGSKMKQVRFKLVPFPRHQVPENAIKNISPFMNSVTLAPLPANLPIFEENLSATASLTNPVIERIPDGMRAITVRVDVTSAVEGWASSGAIVDVILNTKSESRVVAQKVKILSAERSVDPTTSISSPDVPSTVTLLVSTHQALALNAAISLGQITFALRNKTDEDFWNNSEFATDELRRIREKQETKAINGFIQVQGGKKLALQNNKWIESEVVPSGFLPLAGETDEAR